MLPLRRMTRWTEHTRRRLNLPSNDPRVLFAAGFNFNKLLHCVTNTGEVLVSHIPALKPGLAPPPFAAEAALLAQQHGYPLLPEPDAMLQWFEYYADALHSGRFAVESLYDEIPNSRGISLFSRHPPGGGIAITRGIHISAAPVFIPELSNITDVDDGDMQYFFAYSIRFKLLSENEQRELLGAGAGGAEAPFEEVQLLDRAWLIKNSAGAVKSEVRGEGVVGQFPLLEAGGEEFTYQSCTHQRERHGSMEGEFTFIEGSMAQPGPRQIKAVCPEMNLSMPDVVF